MRIIHITAAGLALTVLVVTGCGGAAPVPTDDEIEQIQQLSAAEALALANEWRTTRPTVTTTLRADSVDFLIPDVGEASVQLPVDTMVLAVAPYVTTTHSCAIHSISGCTGELVSVEISVFAVALDGTVLIDEVMTSMDNGFIELWLPRNMEIDLTIEAEGKQVLGSVTTYDTSPTCIVDLQLE
jgi:hypothetical protein